MRLIAASGAIQASTLKMNNKLIKALLLLLVMSGIIAVVIYRDQLDADALQAWIESAGAAAPLVFMLVYVVGTVFFFPGSVLTLLGGALFGPVLGAFYNLTAATIGAMLSFLVARYLASEWVMAKTGGRIKQLVDGVEKEGWRFVAFVRLVPLFPFNLLNYALGLTRISFSQYTIATYICMLPGAIAYTYLGYIGKEAATGGEGLVQKSMLALALLAVVSFLPRIISYFRRGSMLQVDELKLRLDSDEEMLLLDVRTPEDYEGDQGHVAGSVLIPLEELEQRIEELGDYLEKPIVTICRTDRKSAKAAQILAQHGFADVHVVKMGMTDWNAKNYPTA